MKLLLLLKNISIQSQLYPYTATPLQNQHRKPCVKTEPQQSKFLFIHVNRVHQQGRAGTTYLTVIQNQIQIPKTRNSQMWKICNRGNQGNFTFTAWSCFQSWIKMAPVGLRYEPVLILKVYVGGRCSIYLWCVSMLDAQSHEVAAGSLDNAGREDRSVSTHFVRKACASIKHHVA